MAVLYVVLNMKQSIILSETQTVEFKDVAVGCLGAMPVFRSLEEAKIFTKDSKDITILEVGTN